MSAYVVEDETINRIVSWIERETIGSNGMTYGQVSNSLKQAGFDPEDKGRALKVVGGKGAPSFPERLGRAMFDLNCRAVRERYEDADESGMVGEANQFTRVSSADAFAVLKSLHCWHYQCSEGDVPNDPLYKAFEEIIHAIEGALVRQMPQYDTAAWG